MYMQFCYCLSAALSFYEWKGKIQIETINKCLLFDMEGGGVTIFLGGMEEIQSCESSPACCSGKAQTFFQY